MVERCVGIGDGWYAGVVEFVSPARRGRNVHSIGGSSIIIPPVEFRCMCQLRSFGLLAILITFGCGPSDPAPSPPAPPDAARAPSGDPATLPKVAAHVDAITGMLRERFGEAVARNIRVEVENGPQGLRVGLTGEVPNDEIRVAVIREVEARVPDIKFEDFNLDLAGPVPMLFGFPIASNQEKVYFAPDISFAVSQRGTVYETATGRILNRLNLGESAAPRCMELAPDGRTLAVGLRGGEIDLYDMPIGRNRRVLQPRDPDTRFDDPVALGFSRDGKQLVTVNNKNGDIRLWDLARGSAKQIGSHIQPNEPRRTDDRYCVAVSPDGSMIATTNQDETALFLWSIPSRSRIEIPKLDRLNPTVLAWSNDGKTIAVGRTTEDKRGVLLFDVASKKSRILALEQDEILPGLAFSPDDKTLAVAYEDEGIRIWDLASGRVWRTVDKRKCGGAQALAFSRDGAVLATDALGLRPPSIRLWDISQRPGAAATRAALPRVYPEVEGQNDRLAAGIERSIRGTFDRRNIQALRVEVLPDGTIKLTGKVSSAEVKRVAGRNAEVFHDSEDAGERGLNRVVNELEVTGRYEEEN